MIAYDLRCQQGHQFEAWFKNLKTFERQRKEKQIECPRCGSSEIEMVYQAQGIRKKLSLNAGATEGRKMLENIETFLQKNFENVGDDFADEARRVHYGKAEARNIRGEATSQEEKELVEEGITFFKVTSQKASH